MSRDAALSGLEGYLDERIAAGDFPGAVYAIDGPSGLIAHGARGAAALQPRVEPATTDTIYDLASLTKPLATASLLVLLRRAGGFSMEDPASRWIPDLSGTGKAGLVLADLAGHTSGLPAWLPLYVRGGGMDGYVSAIASAPLESNPGSRAVYSCCGYILLGEATARLAAEPLDTLFDRLIARPLGLPAIGYRPRGEALGRVAPTERDCRTERSMVEIRGLRYDGWRSGIIRGEVHDGNAWGLGGVAGNAGLFGTAVDLVLLAREHHGRGLGLFTPEERALMTRPRPSEGEARSFAWQLAATAGSAAHGVLPDESCGHTGFTGVSLWLDPLKEMTYVLLTNRIHPDNRGTCMNAIRREFHRLASRLS